MKNPLLELSRARQTEFAAAAYELGRAWIDIAVAIMNEDIADAYVRTQALEHRQNELKDLFIRWKLEGRK